MTAEENSFLQDGLCLCCLSSSHFLSTPWSALGPPLEPLWLFPVTSLLPVCYRSFSSIFPFLLLSVLPSRHPPDCFFLPPRPIVCFCSGAFLPVWILSLASIPLPLFLLSAQSMPRGGGVPCGLEPLLTDGCVFGGRYMQLGGREAPVVPAFM